MQDESWYFFLRAFRGVVLEVFLGVASFCLRPLSLFGVVTLSVDVSAGLLPELGPDVSCSASIAAFCSLSRFGSVCFFSFSGVAALRFRGGALDAFDFAAVGCFSFFAWPSSLSWSCVATVASFISLVTYCAALSSAELKFFGRTWVGISGHSVWLRASRVSRASPAVVAAFSSCLPLARPLARPLPLPRPFPLPLFLWGASESESSLNSLSGSSRSSSAVVSRIDFRRIACACHMHACINCNECIKSNAQQWYVVCKAPQEELRIFIKYYKSHHAFNRLLSTSFPSFASLKVLQHSSIWACNESSSPRSGGRSHRGCRSWHGRAQHIVGKRKKTWQHKSKKTHIIDVDGPCGFLWNCSHVLPLLALLSLLSFVWASLRLTIPGLLSQLGKKASAGLRDHWGCLP